MRQVDSGEMVCGTAGEGLRCEDSCTLLGHAPEGTGVEKLLFHLKPSKFGEENVYPRRERRWVGLANPKFCEHFFGSEFFKPPRPVLQPFRSTTARQFPSAGVTSSLMPSAFVLISLMFLSVATYAQTPAKFCDLLRNPEKYRDQRVKVRATFRYGFEWQQLYCLDCLDKGRAWLWLPTVTS